MIGGRRSVRQASAGLVLHLVEALGAPVAVLDGTGTVLARVPAAADARPVQDWPTRVPVSLVGSSAEVWIAPLPSGEVLSARRAEVMVNLAAAHAALISQIPNHEELTNRLLLDLVRGRADGDLTMRLAQMLGMDLERPRAVLLVDAALYILEPEPPLSQRDGSRAHRSLVRARRVVSAIERFFGPASDTVCGYIGEGEIIALHEDGGTPAPGRDDEEPSWEDVPELRRTAEAMLAALQQETGVALAAGVGRRHPTVEGLTRSYADARTALLVGRQFRGEARAYSLDALGVEALLAVDDEATRISLGRRLLAPLQREPELLETLATFFAEHCRPSDTAGRLAIHRNTLTYRLEKIAALTGLDPRRFEDAVQLRLALVLQTLRPDPIPLCSRPTAGRPARESLVARTMPSSPQSLSV